MNETYCLVCGAPSSELGPEAGAFTTCPLIDWDDDFECRGDAWAVANCLDEQMSEAEARA